VFDAEFLKLLLSALDSPPDTPFDTFHMLDTLGYCGAEQISVGLKRHESGEYREVIEGRPGCVDGLPKLPERSGRVHAEHYEDARQKEQGHSEEDVSCHL